MFSTQFNFHNLTIFGPKHLTTDWTIKKKKLMILNIYTSRKDRSMFAMFLNFLLYMTDALSTIDDTLSK